MSETTMPSTDLRIEAQETGACTRKLSITVPPERVKRVRQSVAARIANSVRMPGFRKGKTPASIVEKQFGQAIEQETVEKVIQEAYREALESGEHRPIEQGQVDNVHYHAGGELHFEVTFEVNPDLNLARIDGFQVVRPADTVGDDEVDAVLERLRQDRGALSPVEGTPDYGDQVQVEITQLDAEDDAEPSNYRFELGEGQAIPDIEQAIMTLAPGQEGEFTVTFPDDFADEAQRGKEERLLIHLVDAQRKQLPELNDEFATGLGEFDTMEALRQRVRDDLAEDARRRADQAERDGLIGQIVEANPFDVPGSMVERYLDYMTGDVPDENGKRRARGGEEQERISQLRTFMRPQAEAGLKRMMVVEHLADREGLRATADDVDARVEQLAEKHGRSPSDVWVELERSGQMQALESELTEEKVFEHLRARNSATYG
jgi:trigger factor